MNASGQNQRQTTLAATRRHHAWKAATRAELENYFRHRRSPRLMLTSILLLTGTAGLVLCRAMLDCGLLAMWLRYPLAVAGGYGAFLLLMRGWVAWEHFCFDHRAICLPETPADTDLADIAAAEPPRRDPLEPYQFKSGWLDWLDFGHFIPDGEGCLLGILLAILLAILGIVGLAVADAPVLIADVFLDSFLVSILYRKLRSNNPNRWLGTAIRRTYSPALWVAALLALAGAFLQALAPDCHSIGPAVTRIFEVKP